MEEPLYTGAKSAHRLMTGGDYRRRSWHRWVLPVILYQGLRPEKVGQSLVTDIVLERGHWCWRITKIDTTNDLKPSARQERAGKKTLKTRTARRLVPIHPVLLDLGLLRHVQACVMRVTFGYFRIGRNRRRAGIRTRSAGAATSRYATQRPKTLASIAPVIIS